jgi:hypothetical protein
MNPQSTTPETVNGLSFSISLVINQISSAAPENYRASLLNSAGFSDASALNQAVTAAGAHADVPPLTPASNWQLTDAEQKLIAIQIACAVDDINAQFPLQPGETIQENSGTLLSANWGKFTKGTPVITRLTNYSAIYALYPELVFSNNRLQPANPGAAPAVKDADPCWGWDVPVPTDTSTAYLLDALTALEAIPTVGSLLTPFIAMFTTAETSTLSWNDVFQMATCAAQAISKENDVAELQGAMSALYNEITNDYLLAKQNIPGTTGTERTNAMNHAYSIGQSILTALINNMGALSSDNLGAAALSAYTIGASTVTGLYQDLSTVDTSAAEPASSTCIAAMKSYAAAAAAYIQSTVAQLLSERQQAVSLVLETRNKEVCGGGNNPVCEPAGTVTIGAHWYDAITGKKSKSYTSKHSESDVQKEIAKCQADMDSYVNGLITTLQNQFQPLLNAATSLTNPPIPDALPQ